MSSFHLIAASATAPAGLGSIDQILESVRLHLGMDIAFASRIVGGQRQFTHIKSAIPLPLVPGDSELLEDTLCQRVLDGRLPALIHNAADHGAARELPLTQMLPIGAHLNVPLTMRDGSIYGTFCCVNQRADFSITERDMAALRAFADLTARIIEDERDVADHHGALSERIQRTIEREELAVHHQPIVSLETGAAVGVECLARFEDAASRPPNEWFEEAARIGCGVELELLAIRAALRSLPFVPAGLYVSINASPATVTSGRLHGELAGCDRARVVLELTEHAPVADYGELRAGLDELKPFARLAIDDVGAGYAGLRHVLDLRPDIVKLDMSLTRDIDRDPARRALAGAMVAFCNSIRAAIVAEGVETAGERTTLHELGVLLGQGYLFGRPLPALVSHQKLLGMTGARDDVAAVAVLPALPQARAAIG